MVVYRKRYAFAGRASVSTWLYRISVRVAAAQRRLARHRREVACEELPFAAEGGEMEPVELERRALLEHLGSALERLSDAQRDVLALHDLEGLRMREVAARLGVPTKTAFSRVYAARRALAAELRRLGYGVPMLMPLAFGQGGLDALLGASAQAAPAKLWGMRWLERAIVKRRSARSDTVVRRLLGAARSAALPSGAAAWLAVCIALVPPAGHTPGRVASETRAPAPRAADPDLLAAAGTLIPAIPSIEHGPASLAPGSLFESAPAAAKRPKLARRLQERAAPQAAAASAAQEPRPELPPLAAVREPPPDFIVTRMGSEELRPALPHPFAERVQQQGPRLSRMAARLAPRALLPEPPAGFD